MIRFSCRCGHVFEEPDASAGGGVQCPRCMLLTDIPLLSELRSLAEDGTYQVGRPLTTPNPHALPDLIHAFAKTKVDVQGNPIDLRNTADEMQDVGAYDTAEELKRRERPRYDPETGERVTPIPLASAKRNAQPEIPFALTALDYASSEATAGGSVLLKLSQPYNLFVMFCVLCLAILAGMTGVVIVGRLYFFIPVLIAIGVVLVAHYGNVVNEIGVEERDELPRLLGDMRLHDDILLPAVATATAVIPCFGPAIALFLFAPLSMAMAAALAAILALFGTYLFPATLLTLLSSGSIANLRPDRVLAVIHVARGRYLGLVAILLLALVSSFWALASIAIEALRLAQVDVNVPARLTSLAIGLPMMAVSGLLTHYFCWHLGLYYRDNHHRFPWVGRAHQPRPPVVRRKPRYVTQPRRA